MTTIDQDRAKAYIEQAASLLADAFEEGRAEGSSEALADHICPDPWPNPRVRAWHAVVDHPLFEDCHQADGTLLDAVLAKLDAVHDHVCPTVPVWRPTTRDEIQPGWEVRARARAGEPVRWGTARTRDGGDWHDDEGFLLTCGGEFWTVETTAPLPEPWDEGLVMVLAEVISSEPGTLDDEARAVLDLLAAKFPGVRAAITGGER